MEQKRVVLMIDDDSMMLQNAYNILQDFFDVRQARTAIQGLKLLEKRLPDLILLDISMPEMDGFETLSKIREMEKCQEIPVIFLTSVEDTEAEIKGLSLGAVDYIRKPFVPEILITRVKRHMEEGIKTRMLSERQNTNMIVFDETKVEQMKKLLTSTEFEVAKLVASGFENQEIADRLQISYNYAKQVVSKVFLKLGVSKRAAVKTFFIK